MQLINKEQAKDFYSCLRNAEFFNQNDPLEEGVIGDEQVFDAEIEKVKNVLPDQASFLDFESAMNGYACSREMNGFLWGIQCANAIQVLEAFTEKEKPASGNDTDRPI